jgi:leucyl-tRNA synthetase
LVDFKLSTGEAVTVFTTRPDTLFGATCLVLAPEHPLVVGNIANITNWVETEAYINVAKQKDEQDRLDATKEKTGVHLEGVTAKNPASGEEIPVFISDYVLASYGTGAIMAVPAHDERDWEFAKKFNVSIKEVIDVPEQFKKDDEKVQRGNAIYQGAGILINSGEFDGLDSEKAKEKIVEKVGGKMSSTYRLRDWSIGRQRYWGVPIPIVYDPQGVAHPIPKEHLPWVLPTDVDFKPTGEAPLSKSIELKERTEAIFGAGWTPEVETMDTFVDSSWYFLRYLDNANSESLSSLEAQKEWMPIDIYFGGAEHTTMHLLYSRFWQKALLDLGLVTESEPYRRRVNRGLILGPDGNKMSKSKGNVIDPDEHVRTVGSDTVKMYLAFMGPYEGANYPFDLGGIAGVRRFLERAYGLKEHSKEEVVESVRRQLHKTIIKVQEDIVASKFNTAISTMMMFVNMAEKEGIERGDYETFVKVLAPFAPHLTEEIWSELGHTTSIHKESYPVGNKDLATDDEITIAVQINGKVRGTITITPNQDETTVVEKARENEAVAKYLTGDIRKVIYVPGKILNLIV